MKAVLALEDGRLFRGTAYGAVTERVGEVVFNTSLTGYQEIFTDPSYAGQIVVLTNPHIGNYGTSPSDAESSRPYIEGLVVREFSPVSSNWRSTERRSRSKLMFWKSGRRVRNWRKAMAKARKPITAVETLSPSTQRWTASPKFSRGKWTCLSLTIRDSMASST